VPISSALDLETALIADGASPSYTCRSAIFCADTAISSPNASQFEQPLQRALRRANKNRQRLGISVGIAEPLPDKPRGMWARTYGQLLNEISQAEILANEAQTNRFKRLLAQLKNDLD
jgi:hypothetical protein